MSLITPDTDITEMQELLTSVFQSVRALRREFEDLSTKLSAGGDVTTTNVKSAAGQLAAQLTLCQRLETNLAECKRKQAGIAPNATYALDLEKARTSIGCRLDKLRRRPCSDPVPE